MKTLSLLIFLYWERKEDKAFNFQAFKVMLNPVNRSSKTYYVFTLAVLWPVMGEKRHEKDGEMRERRKWSYLVMAFPPSPCSPAQPHGTSCGDLPYHWSHKQPQAPPLPPTTTLVLIKESYSNPSSGGFSSQSHTCKFGQTTWFLTFPRSSKWPDLQRPPFNPPELQKSLSLHSAFLSSPLSQERKWSLSWVQVSPFHLVLKCSSAALSFRPGPFPLK